MPECTSFTRGYYSICGCMGNTCLFGIETRTLSAESPASAVSLQVAWTVVLYKDTFSACVTMLVLQGNQYVLGPCFINHPHAV